MSRAPKARQHYELLPKELDEAGKPIGADTFRCSFCKKTFRSWGETHMRVHLSDKASFKLNHNISALCTMVPPTVAKVFVDYFAEKMKSKEMESSVSRVRLQSEAFEGPSSSVEERPKQVRRNYILQRNLVTVYTEKNLGCIPYC